MSEDNKKADEAAAGMELAGLTADQVMAMETLAINALRAGLASQAGNLFGGDRDIWAAAGYKTELEYEDYAAMYNRQDIAGVIVDKPATDSWAAGFTLYDGEDARGKKDTKFTKAWGELDKRLGLTAAMKKVDELCGVGRYGLLVLGYTDEGKFSDELKGEVSGLAYVRAFAEGDAQIGERQSDQNSPKFNWPKTYTVSFDSEDGGRTEAVDHSRVIHVVENAGSTPYLGRSRLERPYNRLVDLLKVTAGGSEAFWLNMRQGTVFSQDPATSLGPDAKKQVEEEIEKFYHGLTRYIRLKGIDAKPMGVEVADPKEYFEMLISLVVATTRIPRRILLGTESGNLASSQDQDNWSTTVQSRQKLHTEPNILRRLIDELIARKVLPAPESATYFVEWHELYKDKLDDKVERFKKTAEALAKVAPGGAVDAIVDIQKLAQHYLDLPEGIFYIFGDEEPLEEVLLDEQGDEIGEVALEDVVQVNGASGVYGIVMNGQKAELVKAGPNGYQLESLEGIQASVSGALKSMHDVSEPSDD